MLCHNRSHVSVPCLSHHDGNNTTMSDCHAPWGNARAKLVQNLQFSALPSARPFQMLLSSLSNATLQRYVSRREVFVTRVQIEEEVRY